MATGVGAGTRTGLPFVGVGKVGVGILTGAGAGTLTGLGARTGLGTGATGVIGGEAPPTEISAQFQNCSGTPSPTIE